VCSQKAFIVALPAGAFCFFPASSTAFSVAFVPSSVIVLSWPHVSLLKPKKHSIIFVINVFMQKVLLCVKREKNRRPKKKTFDFEDMKNSTLKN